MKIFNFRNVVLITSLCIAVGVIFFKCEHFVPLWSGGVVKPVVLHADENGHFFGSLDINGVTLKYIVDSGASHITLNSHDATKAKIDYTNGSLISLITPSGELQAFSVKLNALMIGSVALNNVEATVLEGDFPPYVLLGISTQNRLDVKRDNAVMTLGEKRQ